MELAHRLFHLLRHLNEQQAWQSVINYVGPNNIYVLLFAIIFAETGLVIWPFLPGDSLLFAVGVVAATSASISLPKALILMCIAANCGDAVNYFFGRSIGPKVFSREDSWMLNKKHLLEAHQFYEKHGRKTIILARFVPIVRTFAPFVAGIGKMNFLNFAAFSIARGAMWVSVCLIAGYKLAKVEFVQKHFQLMVLAIIFVSILPMIVHAVQAKRRRGAVGFEVIINPTAPE